MKLVNIIPTDIYIQNYKDVPISTPRTILTFQWPQEVQPYCFLSLFKSDFILQKLLFC